MSLLGMLFGYDIFGNDLIGYPQDKQNACVACGLSCSAHTIEMNNICTRNIWGNNYNEFKLEDKNENI